MSATFEKIDTTKKKIPTTTLLYTGYLESFEDNKGIEIPLHFSPILFHIFNRQSPQPGRGATKNL